MGQPWPGHLIIYSPCTRLAARRPTWVRPPFAPRFEIDKFEFARSGTAGLSGRLSDDRKAVTFLLSPLPSHLPKRNSVRQMGAALRAALFRRPPKLEKIDLGTLPLGSSRWLHVAAVA